MRRFGAFALGCLAMFAAGLSSAQAQEKKSVKFILDFIPLARHAPWYTAIGKGFYAEEGLDVTILPAKGTADAIRGVESGIAEFGFIDVPSLVAAGTKTSIRIVAVNYQNAPYAVMSTDPGANVTTPEKMVGLELGSSTGSFVPRIHMAFMKMKGLDPSTLKVVNIEPASRAAMLIAGKVQAIDLFAMSAPSLEKGLTNAKLRMLLFSDFGLQLYSNSIGVKEELLKSDPELVKKFVRASLKGWQYALRNPAEAVEIESKIVKGVDPQIGLAEMEIVRKLADTADTREKGLGAMDPAKMKATIDFMTTSGATTGTPLTLDEVMAPGFLPAEPIKP